jgi:raffinose/stachyose/melibiose transport system permease protein
LWYITIPLLGSTIRTTTYLSALGSLQVFGLVWVMTRGGPVNASDTMATYLYRYGFIRFYLGYGCAVAIILFLLCLTFSLVFQGITRNQDVVGETA